MSFDVRTRQGVAVLVGLAVAIPLLVGQGCPPGAPGVGLGPVVVVKSPSLDQTVTAGELVTIVYDAVGATSVSAFYDIDGIADSGDEVQFGTNLASGSNKFTQLSTVGLPAGVYRLGITASNSSGSSTAYAAGRLTVAGAPSIVFTSPVGELRVGAGVRVPVRFNAGVGVTDFSYRTFYDTDGVFNGNEITIQTGSSNGSSIVESEFDTTGMAPGTYFIGVRVTPAGKNPTTAYAVSTLTIVSGAFVQVLSPTVGLVALPGTQVQIIVAASDPASTASTIRIFYDPEGPLGPGNGVTIATIPVAGSGTVWDTTNVPLGSYYVGAELQNGLLPAQVSYSAGPVTFLSSAAGTAPGVPGTDRLRVTTPLIPSTVIQGHTFRVNWVTNLQPGEGTVTIFREPDRDGDGVPDGIHTREVIGFEGIDAAQQFVDFDTTGVVGTYFIVGVLTPNTGPQETAFAPGTLTIRPLTLWAGELGTRRTPEGTTILQTGFFQGATFRGFNFHDNLGSAMVATDDYDGDGRNEILLGAQFAKPFMFSQDGRGAGEAYLIYGQRQRYRGDFDVNAVGSADLPGVVFSGIVPNPFDGSHPHVLAKAGTSIPYTVDGQFAPPFATEGLRSITLIPDQDGDGRREIVFGFPWVNSFSLSSQAAMGTLPVPLPGIGRLENNGHFLRGGVVVVSSRNPVLASRTAISRHFDRVIELHEVGQIFSPMTVSPPSPAVPARQDNCPALSIVNANDTVTFPCDGFWQRTDGVFIDPPRLADPMRALRMIVHPDVSTYGCDVFTNFVSIDQVDSPPPPSSELRFEGMWTTNDDDFCEPSWPPFGTMQLIGSGFYGSGTSCGEREIATARPPYGARLLGQTTTQLDTPVPTTANRFGHSVSVSGDFLLVGAPLRTMLRSDVPFLPTPSRVESGVVYMVPLKRPGAPENEFMYALPPDTVDPDDDENGITDYTPSPTIPYPHNWIVRDVGYTRYDTGCNPLLPLVGSARASISRPFHIVGAAPGDRLGDVTGLNDINNDGVSDFAVGAPFVHGGRGAVYVIYRRQPEVEGDYLLEHLQHDPLDIRRLNGLMILGQPGENLGTSIAGGGDLNDDYNNSGHPDLLIGSPRSTPASGFQAGQVFILFGGRNLLNPAGGSTIDQLVASGDGMLLTGDHPGDMAGTTVANAGDVNGDGIPDILIAAPNASPRFDSTGDGFADTIGIDLNGDGTPDDLDGDGFPDDLTNAGIVYVVFGGKHLTGVISLDQIGTPNLPGFKVVGRKANHHLGGGLTQDGLLSRGVAAAGDLDGDGRADILISSVLADPEGKTNAGEVYLIYGFRP